MRERESNREPRNPSRTLETWKTSPDHTELHSTTTQEHTEETLVRSRDLGYLLLGAASKPQLVHGSNACIC